MTPTIEQAIEIIRQLPPPDREKVRDWIDEENQRQTEPKQKNRTRKKHRKVQTRFAMDRRTQRRI